MTELEFEGGSVLPAFGLRILQGLMISITVWLVACHKKAPEKAQPAPIAVVKKSPAEIKQLTDAANQSLAGLKPLLGGLNARFVALHEKFDPLPSDLPDFGETRGKFNAVDEGLGRMNAKLTWLVGQIDAAAKAGDAAELEELNRSIANSYDEVREVDKLASELLHEVMPFERVAAELEARRKAQCESGEIGASTAAAAAAMSKRMSAH